jgi:3-hydroxy-9,10-secoandrosta-1,3,5(10)-triene-9,17-dione monooxygenase reductase component
MCATTPNGNAQPGRGSPCYSAPGLPGLPAQDSQIALPGLEGVLAVMEWTVEHSPPGGDHEIVVGRVRHVEISATPDTPLVYFRGGYASLAS